MSEENVVPSGWLTTEEVATLAGCSRETVIRAIRSNQIAKTKKGGGNTWLVDRAAGVAWAEKYVPYEGLRKGDAT